MRAEDGALKPAARSWLLALMAGLGTLVASGAQAQVQIDRSPETGWQTDTRGMRHFTGLSCPDQVGRLSRVGVLSSGPDRIAGCIYLTPEGISAVLRSHPHGSSERTATAFVERYTKAGFQRIQTSGPAAAGVSFGTASDGASQRCETLWRFTGRSTDFTLWMAYSLPAEGELIAPLLNAFVAQIAAMP